MISLIQNDNPQNVLDVGCGTGAMLEMIQEKYPEANCTGADLSSSMIEFAAKSHPHFTFCVADAIQLPFNDSSFDVVTNAISFHHYTDPTRAVKEAYRVLKPGGQFLLMDITPKNKIIRKIHDFGANYLVRDGHHAFQSLANTRELFRQSGLKDIKQTRVGHQAVYITSGIKT